MFYFKRNKLNEEKVWHKWFAWYPVTVSTTNDGDKKVVWLGYVLRCFQPYWAHGDYGCRYTAYAKKYKELEL